MAKAGWKQFLAYTGVSETSRQLNSTDELPGRLCLQTGCQSMGPCCSLSGVLSADSLLLCSAAPASGVPAPPPSSPLLPPGCPKCSDRLTTRNSRGGWAENPAGDLEDWASGFSDVHHPPTGSQQISLSISFPLLFSCPWRMSK